MAEAKALVRNAGDPDQVKRAKAAERFMLDNAVSDLSHLLSQPQGRRFFSRFLAECGTMVSVFNGHGSLMAYNAGRQDVGFRVLGEITQANPQAWILMQQESLLIEQKKVEPEPVVDDE